MAILASRMSNLSRYANFRLRLSHLRRFEKLNRVFQCCSYFIAFNQSVAWIPQLERFSKGHAMDSLRVEIYQRLNVACGLHWVYNGPEVFQDDLSDYCSV